MADVVVPEVGETGMEVTFVRWLRNEGDEVKEGDVLFELDTNKATMEVEAYASGRLVDLRVSAGELVVPQQVVARIEQAGTRSESLPAEEAAPPMAAAEETAPPMAAAETARSMPPLSPKARRLAAERGIDVSGLRGSGPDGMVTERDVLAAAGDGDGSEPVGAPVSPAAPAAASAIRDRVRRAVAERTVESWRTIPHFSLRAEVDVTDRLPSARPMALIAEAVVAALREHPECNLRWQAGEIVPREAVDLGILVDTPSGLLLVAVRNADRLDTAGLESAIRAAADRARSGLLGLDDSGSHSITLSNLGMFAVDEFTGIIPTGDVLLLAFGRVRSAGRWIEDVLARRDIVTLTLTVDHRALSGADAARFLTTLQRHLTGEREDGP